MADAGTITFSTALDNEQLEAELKATGREVDNIKRKLERADSSKNAIEIEMERAEAAIHETEAEVDALKAKLASLEGAPLGTPGQYIAQQEAIKATRGDLDEATKSLDKQISAIDGLNNKWQNAESRSKAYSTQLDEAKARQKELAAEYQRSMASQASSAEKVKAKQDSVARSYGKSMSAGTEAVRKSTADAEGRMDKLGRKINALAKKAFVFSLIAGALDAMKDHLAETMQENDRFAASLAVLKATMAGFAAPLVNGIATALTGLMNILSSMLMTLARLVDSVFKTDIAGSIRAAREAAQAAEREAKAKKKTAKATKEASKSVMAFDELNAMQADKSAEKDEEPQEASLDFGALGAGQIDEKLGAIMVILGAALMAVGAILAFSGINIPLGITLMAIGALMVYTALQEQWGLLPAEVQQAITTALVIGGILLLVIGAVLAFTGVNVPLGIALIAAGAIMLGTAAAINWNSMDAETRGSLIALMAIIGVALLVVGAILALTGINIPLGVGLIAAGAVMLGAAVALSWNSMDADTQAAVSGLMAILCIALLVIGAILTFTGANPMLGVGLMLLGAAGLAALVFLNWNSMTPDMQNAVTELFKIVGVAFLVVGAILALTGVAAPLGVGLMIIGAGMLATAVALNWDSMTPEMQDEMTKLLLIIGGCLIVIGIILLFTGAGIPLGIACILAGIGMFVGAAALNWDFLQEKIKEIWNGIVSFWNTYIAPIFTLEWWQEKFRCIVNGLIYAINCALGSFGDFINSITGGIGDILGFFGLDWSLNVRMPQIPYLAQGAVIPPNRKFLAVLGDQTSGTNLEAPESLIRQIVREEAGGNAEQLAAAVQQAMVSALMQMAPALQQPSDRDVTMVLQVGNEELARAVSKGSESLLRRGELRPELAFGL